MTIDERLLVLDQYNNPKLAVIGLCLDGMRYRTYELSVRGHFYGLRCKN
jgi:hypothetical protein